MNRTLIERRLSEQTARLKELRDGLRVADEQLEHFQSEAEEARIRALVSETPLAERDHRESERHAEAMRRHRADLVREIEQLERSQDDLLDRLMAEIG